MTDGPQSKQEPNRTDLPGWIRACMMLVGGVLLLGPTLAVIWPR